MLNRIPFHFGMFYYAMIGLIGREPDHKCCLGYNGYYSFWYYPKNEEEIKSFSEHACTLAEWLDNFEIIFSKSICEYRKHPDKPEYEKIIWVTIQHPIEKSSSLPQPT